ncbi:hypothetical protein ACWA1F_13345 [Flavobacterium sp. 3-218]
MRTQIAFFILIGSSFLSTKAQSLNPFSHISAAGSADSFNAGYTFAYATSGTPWNGSLISYGGFPINNYDTQISSDYGPGGGKHISFRTKNGDINAWNPWIELATKGENDFAGKQSISGNLGLGLSEPLNKLHVHGTHTDSRILLHSAGADDQAREADLMLWASEPGLTYTGVGIGNNIHNYNNPNGGLKLLNTARGGSYIRLLDCAMQFNVVNSGGVDMQAIAVNTSGNVGIGNSSPIHKLDVNGTVHSREVKVDLNFPAPDYVFKDDYNLRSLQEVENFIKENSHLPEIPSAKEFENNGINVSEMNMALLKKIEEMTLYMIEMKKDISALQQENKLLNTKLAKSNK